MSTTKLTRRGFLSGTVILGSSALLAACSVDNSGGSARAKSSLQIQSYQSDANPKAAMTALAKGYKGSDVVVNSIPNAAFLSQVSSYLSNSNPPDVLTWFSGTVAAGFAKQGLLGDLSPLWTGSGACARYSPAMRQLSTAADGKQILVPMNYYGWGIFYLKSKFAEWGVEPPTTWSEFMALCKKLKGKGVIPLIEGTGSATPWVAAGWFDYLDLRINGAEFHLDLLHGKHSFDSPEVYDVLQHYASLVPYMDPAGASFSWQQAVTPLLQGKAAMSLIGSSFISGVTPASQIDDLDFFVVPTIDESVPFAEEAPTDGFIMSARGGRRKEVQKFLNYAAGPEAQLKYILDAKSAWLPAGPGVDTSKLSRLAKKQLKILTEAKQLTQFFNRDSSGALLDTADAALNHLISDPSDIRGIMKSWQQAAQQVWNS